jgi:crossover junction endodeoxyribonuclease RusA
MKVLLPFPPAKLSPNARGHWAAIAKVKKDYRWQCAIQTRARLRKPVSWWDAPSAAAIAQRPLPITITFNPPDRRARDRDNMIAAFKSGQDGFADAIGVDDSKFEPTYRVGEPVKGGSVTIEITGRE